MRIITVKLWFAKDKDGDFHFFASPPERNEKDECWVGDYVCSMTDVSYEIPSIHWEDEPFECELKVKIE